MGILCGNCLADFLERRMASSVAPLGHAETLSHEVGNLSKIFLSRKLTREDILARIREDRE